MPIYQRTRASVLDALIAVCALSALASAGHSADASDPPRNPGLPCGYEVAAIIKGPVHPFFGQASLIATGMNEHGWATGFYFWLDTDHAFYWTPDTGLHTIPLPDGFNRAIANDVNDHGVVVGDMEGPGQHWRGFVYDTTTGTMTILEPVQNIGSAQCWANAINNDGVVVGARSLGETEQPYNAFIWTPDEDDPNQGTYTDLGVMNGPNSTALDVSDSGITVGLTGTQGNPNRRGFMFAAGQLTIMPAVPSGFDSGCNSVNEDGAISGGGLMDPKQVPEHFGLPARWISGGWQLLPIYDFCWSAAAFDIDNQGRMVGRCTTPQQIESFPLMWIDDEMIDIAPLIEPVPGVEVRVIRGINAAGQLLAAGRLNGSSVAFLLEPVGPFIGDLNNDCTVGPDDLTLLLSEWATRNSSADLNGDGIVNGADLAILLGAWTR